MSSKKFLLRSSLSMSYPSFPEYALEHVLTFLDSDRDRNSVSLVCKDWYNIEKDCRKKIFVGNCYAVSPDIMINRFPQVTSVRIKGKPHFDDFNLVPEGWGGYAQSWISSMSREYTRLEEIRLKRMVVTDEDLELISSSFKYLKVLDLCYCNGFSADGLVFIAANCRNLKELNLRLCNNLDLGGHWLSHFPDNFTSLESLHIDCLGSEVCFSALEHLVGRCPNLRTLRLNPTIPLEMLANLLRRAPQLAELGTGSLSPNIHFNVFSTLKDAFSGCKQLKGLSGFWDPVPDYLPALYSACPRLTSLNLCYAPIQNPQLAILVGKCPNLQRLWVLDYIEDTGLEAVAATCKDLQDLRVFPTSHGVEPNVALTEKGLVSVSEGCPKLQSVLYFCRRMTNAALVTIARNRPNMTHFRLRIIDHQAPDYATLEPLDTGFGAIAEHCKELRRFSISGLLTDSVFGYIGKHAQKLEMLSIAFAGNSYHGLDHLLSGCGSLRKLEIRDCPFGGEALLANAAKLETMRSLWMSSCSVRFEACRFLGQNMSRLNVEVIDEEGTLDTRQKDCEVKKLYIYRTVAGPRSDMPGFIRRM